jgi:hypothetical protein
LWYERLRVQSPLIAQNRRADKRSSEEIRRKEKNVENEKTCSIERIIGN